MNKRKGSLAMLTTRLLCCLWMVSQLLILVTVEGTTSSRTPSLHPSALSKSSSSVIQRSLVNANSKDAEKLMTCINSNQVANASTTWSSSLHTSNNRVEVVKVLWSEKRSNLPLTLITQLSWNRIFQLRALCRSYSGPISAALYIFTLKDKSRTLASELQYFDRRSFNSKLEKITEYYANISATSACSLDLLIAHEYVFGKPSELYPVNILRNYARLQARTKMVGLLDVDLITSQTLSSEMNSSKALDTLKLIERHSVVVLPAFTTSSSDLLRTPTEAEKHFVEDLVRKDKSHLLTYYDLGKVKRFAFHGNFHTPTNYEKWFQTNHTYQVKNSHLSYEPWVLASRTEIPWHDARFRGYGQNKITHILAMKYKQFKFYVHPTAFIIHRPHSATKSRKSHTEGSARFHSGNDEIKSDSMFGRNTRLYREIKLKIDLQTYKPHLDPGTEACKEQLPWWKDN